MRKITLLFAVLLSLLGVTQVKAETADFNSGLPEGWSIVGDLSRNSDRARSGSGIWTSSKSDNANYLVTEAIEGTLTFYARAYNKNTNAYVRVYEYTGSALGDQLYITSNMNSGQSTPSWSQYSTNLGDYKGQVAIALNYAAIDDVTYTPYETVVGPALTVKDGDTKVSSPYAFDFGLATAGTTHTFTLSNPGSAALEGLTVSETGNYNASLSASSIAASGNATLTITMPATTGSSAITISNTSGVADFVINASGTVKDPNKMFEDFSGATLPDGWSKVDYSSTYQWTFTNQYASVGFNECSLTTPKLTFEKDELFFFDARNNYNYGTSGYVKVQTSTDGENFVDLQTFSAASDLEKNTWKNFYVTIPSADVKYVRFLAKYSDIDNVYGGELPVEPNMVITQPASLDFGFFEKDASPAPTKTFTIANTGLATLNGINVTSANAAFSITGAPTSLAAGASQEVTITMSTATAGALSSHITVSATDMTDATFTVTGYVADNTKFFENFNGNALPDGWTDNTGWTFNNGKAISGTDTQMTLPALTVAAGEKMAIYVNATGSNPELYYYTSTDGGSTWSAKSSNLASEVTTSAYSIVFIEGLAAGNYKLKLQGYHVQLDAVNGFSLNENAPELGVSFGGSAIATGYDDNFGNKIKAQPAAHTYTITNTGTGTLTGTITSSVPGHFTVSESAFNLAKGATLDFDLNLVFNETYEAKASVITIHPTNGGLTDFVINASATTKDPEIWEEDFESGIPVTWINENSAWTTDRYGHAGQAGPGNNKTSALITPRLQATADQALQFDVIDAESETYFLKAEYSTNRTDWTTIENYITEGTKSFIAPADGYYWLRFTGNYTYVDNFYGFKEAPLAHDAVIASKNIPATGSQYVEYTASVTVNELLGKADEVVTAELWIGTTKVASETDVTLNASAAKTIELSFTPATAMSGDAYIKVYNGDESINLISDVQAVTIAAATILDEDVAPELTETTLPSVVLKYTAVSGWGTICVPFALTSDMMTSIFGTGWKAYEFKSFNDGELGFQNATTFYAGYPYIVHVTTAATHAEGVKLQSVNISRTTAQYDTYSSAYFRGTYAPIAAGGWTKNVDTDAIYGVSNAGKIAPANASTTMKGFRAYFDLPAGTEARLSIYDDATGITTILDAKKLCNDGKVYNLNGQQIENATNARHTSTLGLKKGVYIVNGKKVVVK